MKTLMGSVIALAAAMGISLVTPASSKAGDPCCYSYPVVYYYPNSTCCYGTVVPSSSTWHTVPASGYYQPATTGVFWPQTGGVWQDGGSRWGRYGNVIINRRRWGDLENRVSYGDLIRW